jgi:hypothetical protein
VTHSS